MLSGLSVGCCIDYGVNIGCFIDFDVNVGCFNDRGVINQWSVVKIHLGMECYVNILIH